MNTPHHHSHTRSLLATVAVAIPAMLIGSGLSTPPAQAGYIVTLEQVGSDVVATGTGTLDLTGLSFNNNTSVRSFISPGSANIITGPTIGVAALYTGSIAGPLNFGSGGATIVSSGIGDLVGVEGSVDLFVPTGYVSGSLLSDSSTYTNQTLSSLGATPGTYTWTWGAAAADHIFTLQVGPAAVPAPLIGRGLPVLLAVGGLLFGAKLLERAKRHWLQFG